MDIGIGSHLDDPSVRSGPLVAFNDDGYYWFLYRYFEAAKVDRRTAELLDLYGDAEIGGYQMERLADELTNAREDAQTKPDEWSVLVGWRGGGPSRKTEIRRPVTRDRMLNLIDHLLALINDARARGLKLIAVGD